MLDTTRHNNHTTQHQNTPRQDTRHQDTTRNAREETIRRDKTHHNTRGETPGAREAPFTPPEYPTILFLEKLVHHHKPASSRGYLHELIEFIDPMKYASKINKSERRVLLLCAALAGQVCCCQAIDRRETNLRERR